MFLALSVNSSTTENSILWRDCAFISKFCNGNDFKINSSQVRKKYLKKWIEGLFGDMETPSSSCGTRYIRSYKIQYI